ncbi:MAG: hypothetical protein R2770_09755 [Acidimicrobiales bacterium]
MKRVWILDHLGVALVVGAALGFAAVGGAAAWVAYSVESHWESVGYEPVTCASLAEVEHYAPASTIEVAGAGMYEYYSGPAWFTAGLLVGLALLGAVDIALSGRPNRHGRGALVALAVSVVWVLGVLVVNYDTGCLIDVVHQVARD